MTPDTDSIPADVRARIAELEHRVRELEDRERAERELRRAAESASAAKTFFVASVSHEVRTPLTAILGYADLLRDDGLSPRERAAHLETIRRNGDHLLAVVGDILDLARIDAGQFAIVPADVVVADLVHEVVRLLALRAAAHGVTLDHVVADAVARMPVRTDPVRVRQVLLNIVGNAVKFTERGGVRVTPCAAARSARSRTTSCTRSATTTSAGMESVSGVTWAAPPGFRRTAPKSQAPREATPPRIRGMMPPMSTSEAIREEAEHAGPAATVGRFAGPLIGGVLVVLTHPAALGAGGLEPPAAWTLGLLAWMAIWRMPSPGCPSAPTRFACARCS
ncbi:MAG: sensor histidine kinase [Phycisphaerales bacterium]